MKKYVLIGGAKGLGFEVLKKIATDASEILVCSRSPKAALSVVGGQVTTQKFDATKESTHAVFLQNLKLFGPTHIYYFSGGGPFGPFAKKEYKDHLWAYQLNLLFPAKLLHFAMQNLELEQLIFTGSSVAEALPDPNAASYSSAKHGLAGLIKTVQLEGVPFDLRLFSPSYMSTPLLPKKAKVYNSKVVDDPACVAETFIKWSQSHDGARHYQLEVKEL